MQVKRMLGDDGRRRIATFYQDQVWLAPGWESGCQTDKARGLYAEMMAELVIGQKLTEVKLLRNKIKN